MNADLALQCRDCARRFIHRHDLFVVIKPFVLVR